MGIGKISNATPASFTTSNGTFDLADQDDLHLVVNITPGETVAPTSNPFYGGNEIDIEFETGQFANIAAATAAEVAAVLNAAFAAEAAAGQPPAAVAAVSGSAVKVTSVRTGIEATLYVVGGSAVSKLGLTAETLYQGTGVPGVGAQPSAPTFVDILTFTGDASVSAGGSPGFGAAVRAYFGDNRTVLAALAQDCGGYLVSYEPATDKLKYWKSAGSAAAMVEATGDLSGTTFNVMVISA